MNAPKVLSLITVSLALLLCTAAPAPAAEATGAEVGEVRLRTMAPITYAYVETETSFDKLGESIGAAIPQLMKAAEDGKIRIAGTLILNYPKGSAHLTPDKPFKVQIGFLIQDGGVEAGNVKVRKTEPFRAATVLYTGPPSGIGQCYQKLFPAIKQMGLTTTGEEREFTFYWENMESPNNVMLVQVGIIEQPRAGGAGGFKLPALVKGIFSRKSTTQAVAAVDPPAGAPMPAQLKFLEPLVGAWESTSTETSPSQPDPITRTGAAEIKWILGGRFLHLAATSSNGTEAQAVVTFDADRNQFRRWYFHSRTGFSESWGDFDKKSQTFSWKSELPNGATATLIDRHIDKDNRAWNVLAKNRDGHVIFQVDATSKRIERRPAAATVTPAASESIPELKVLDRYVGTWDGKATLKPGPWIQQEIRQSDVGSIKWAIGGRFLQINSSSREAGDGLHFMGWDEQRQAYRHWLFHSLHGASESTGQWDEKTTTFTWKSQLPMNVIADMTDRWLNDNQHTWNYVIRDHAGKVMFEMEATSTRRK